MSFLTKLMDTMRLDNDDDDDYFLDDDYVEDEKPAKKSIVSICMIIFSTVPTT